MRAIVQRVKEASVAVNAQEISRIGYGFLVLIAVRAGDGPEKAKKMGEKLARLRIIADEAGKMNLSLLDLKQEVLLVSQFTLYGDCTKGNRPSFIGSVASDEARPLIEMLADELRAHGLAVQTGSFGEHMEVALINDGPTTIIIET
ncbi:MAG: D-aminoacyl-tRNA deacylase [bacterium]|nr:D-aminoacyl-tRNA deacylase [bacterium]